MTRRSRPARGPSVLAGLILVVGLAGAAPTGASPEAEVGAAEPGVEERAAPGDLSRHGFELIDGRPTSLAAYRGKVVLVVNTASRCGLTPQYEALEKLYREHREAGLVVLGFPSNDFAGQEPGSNEDIAAFCRENYGVTFPMAAKVVVRGEGAHPLFRALAALPEPLGGEPAWNFTKFLIGRDGVVAARFEPRTTPDDPKVLEALRRLLEEEG